MIIALFMIQSSDVTMASRKEGIFFFHGSAHNASTSEKENQNPSMLGAAAAASFHKPLSRRATCPNMTTGRVKIIFIKVNYK